MMCSDGMALSHEKDTQPKTESTDFTGNSVWVTVPPVRHLH